jgi:hypothetical protein
MHVSCDPKAELDAQNPRSASFGWTPTIHDSEAETRIIASAAFEHIYIDTVNAFDDFCR